jgi:hypothetical protein
LPVCLAAVVSFFWCVCMYLHPACGFLVGVFFVSLCCEQQCPTPHLRGLRCLTLGENTASTFGLCIYLAFHHACEASCVMPVPHASGLCTCQAGWLIDVWRKATVWGSVYYQTLWHHAGGRQGYYTRVCVPTELTHGLDKWATSWHCCCVAAWCIHVAWLLCFRLCACMMLILAGI